MSGILALCEEMQRILKIAFMGTLGGRNAAIYNICRSSYYKIKSSSSTSPLLQSSLEVIISQNDNALGVFSLTETTIAFNDDDRSSVMVTISRTGGQLEEVTVCMQVCMPLESMASQVSILLTNQYFTCSNTPALVCMCTIPSPPLPSPLLPSPQLEWSVDYTNLQQLQVLLSSLFVETRGRVTFSAGQTTASFTLALQPTNVSTYVPACDVKSVSVLF